MKTFRLEADCTFEARDIDDAFSKLAARFVALTTGDHKAMVPLQSGHIELKPLDEKNGAPK